MSGTVTYEWMEGGFFLIQRVDLEQYGQRIKGIELIGHERPFGSEPSEEIKSRFYSNTGDTLDYVYDLAGNTLTIWGGERGSPAYAKCEFSEDDKTGSGEWVYPGGGGLAEAVQEATGESVELAYVDQGYSGERPAEEAETHGISLEVVKYPEAKRGFVLLPRRWVVERDFAWASRFRRLAKDYERLPTTLAGLHFVAFACLFLSQATAVLGVGP